MTDLRTTYLGLSLRSPLVASASPATAYLHGLLALQDAGAAAVVLPSLFEEEADETTWPDPDAVRPDSLPDLEFEGGGPARYAKLTASAKAALHIPVIASLNGTTPSGWVSCAQQLEQAGADAIELNLYAVAADPWRSGSRVEEGYLDVVRLVRGAVEVPLAVKLSPYLSATAHFCRQVVEAGADGLVLFNRFYQPDIDLDTLDVRPRVALSDPSELRLPLRWLALLTPVLPATSFAATTGVHSGQDAAKVLLAGADVVMMASALLRHGPAYIGTVEAELTAWMLQRGYDSVDGLRGLARRDRTSDPAAYERANYLRTLASYRPHWTLG
ncbi:dihydroorotate dehydrogenase-like protein [Dactylosporangium sp. NBC_01737]|uniref:dihydroorotate dehydrogenase-like protein n=1 Tax=Dactylosporangium sp. NBC_01737 TaxID=2975959 RepID=UPI002E0E014A|nr:dihydroorotate dehydrogenase-like protein [Dactylosporangium sp. NBC_01737]